jgi:type I restriction enzyme, S subunit
VLADGEYCLGRGVAGLRTGSELDDRYLWHWTTAAAPTLAAKGRGATFLQVNRSDIAELEIPLPPIEEQRRIGAVLDAADALRAKRREARAKLDTLTQAIFVDMFGDPREVIRGGSAALLGEVAEIINGDRGKNYPQASEFVDRGIPFVNAGHLNGDELDLATTNFVTDEVFTRLRSGKFRDTDLLFCIRGSLGKIGRVPIGGQGAIASSLVIIRPGTDVRRDFLFHVLAGPVAAEQIIEWDNGTAQPNLGASSLAKFKVPLPPLGEQAGFLDAIERLPREAALLQAQLLDRLFESLQQQAFRGEL